MLITSIDGQTINSSCLACSIANKEITPYSGIIYESTNFIVSQDIEIPIPGFLIISSKKHIQSILDFSPEELQEFTQVLFKTRNSLKQVGLVDFISIIQKEIRPHFHLWLLPRLSWMEKFGDKLSSITEILEYARQNLKTEENLKIISDLNSKIKNFINQ